MKEEEEGERGGGSSSHHFSPVGSLLFSLRLSRIFPHLSYEYVYFVRTGVIISLLF